MANEFFTKSQAGIESTPGTPVAAAKILVGQAMVISTDTKLTFPEEQFGVRARSRRAIAYERMWMGTRVINECGFQNLLLPLLTGIKGSVAGAEQTSSQHDYLHTFTPSMTAAAGLNAPQAFTLQLGDDEQAWRVPYCHTDRITLKGSMAQDGGAAPVTMEQGIFGRYIEENAFTGSLSPEASTPMNAKLSRLFLNTAWASVGTTEVTDALVDWTLEIIPNLHPRFRGAAANYFNNVAEGIFDVTLALTLESLLRDELLASQQAGDLQVIQLAVNGPQIGTGDTHNLTVNLSGQWEDVTPRASSERGDNLATLAFHPTWDITASKMLEIFLTTDQSGF